MGRSHEKSARDVNGILRSTIWVGLCLDPSALLSGASDTRPNDHQSGLDSPDQGTFKAVIQEPGREPAG